MKRATFKPLLSIAMLVAVSSCSHRAPTAAPSPGLTLSVCSPQYQTLSLEGGRIYRYSRREILRLGKLTAEEEARGITLIRVLASGRDHVHFESSDCEETVIPTDSEPRFTTIMLDERHDPAVRDLLSWFDEIGSKYLEREYVRVKVNQ
jgi:hypothetical protein